MSANPQDDLRAAYDAGFEASGEGWNGEYPAGVMEEAGYKMGRAQWIAHFILDAPVASAPAPSDPAGAGGDLGELERLSKAATQGLSTVHEGQPDDHGPEAGGGFTFCLGQTRRTGGGRVIHKFGFAEDIYRDHSPAEWAEAEATIRLLSRLWNAYRSGHLVASTPGQGAGEDLVSYLHRQWAWSKETFGPALRTKGIVQHITKELREIEAEPHDLAEWVDVIILAMDGFWRHGGKPEDLLPAMQAKQDKNFARQWPDWRTMGEDQAIEHDRSSEGLTPAQTPPSPPSATPEGDPPMTVEEALGEPHCWVVPGRDTANDYGFIDACCFQKGELSRPLWTLEDVELALRTLHAAGEVRHG